MTVEGTGDFRGGVTGSARGGWSLESGDRMGWGFVVGLWGQSLGGCGWRDGSGGTGPNLPVPLLWVPKHSLPRGSSSSLGGRADWPMIDATVQLKVLPCPPQHGSQKLVTKSAC